MNKQKKDATELLMEFEKLITELRNDTLKRVLKKNKMFLQSSIGENMTAHDLGRLEGLSMMSKWIEFEIADPSSDWYND